MKIKNQKDKDLLTAKIINDYDIDINKYRNDDVASAFAELLIFPKYVINWGIRPIIISLILYIIGFSLIDLDNSLDFIAYFSIGFLLFFLCGFLFAIVFLIRKMKNDMGSIMEYSIGILKEATEDISDLNEKLSRSEKKEGIKLLYLGIMHIVTIPSVTSAIRKQYTFIGFPLSWIIKKFLTAVANAVTVKDLEKSVKLSYSKKNNTYQDEVIEVTTSHKSMLQKVVDLTVSIIEFPFKFLLVLALLALIGLIYMVH
ncbi:MAG: hypothetical protein ACI9P5_003062 [Saprospiraceae bacterium]|jgi:hypothetical protein|tara:strand:- start:806 stop:1576 length:771 start_codon:yes stop_codon:yes gene_type:complete